MIDVHGPPAEGEVDQLPLDLLGRRPGRGPFLGHADQHHPFRGGELLTVALDDVVLALTLGELDPRDALCSAEGLQGRLERGGDLHEQRRRGDDVPALAQERRHPVATLEAWHIAIELQSVDAVDRQRDMVPQHLGHIGHRVLSPLLVATDTLQPAITGSPTRQPPASHSLV